MGEWQSMEVHHRQFVVENNGDISRAREFVVLHFDIGCSVRLQGEFEPGDGGFTAVLNSDSMPCVLVVVNSAAYVIAKKTFRYWRPHLPIIKSVRSAATCYIANTDASAMAIGCGAPLWTAMNIVDDELEIVDADDRWIYVTGWSAAANRVIYGRLSIGTGEFDY